MTQKGAIDLLIELLKRGKFDYADEKICQEQIEKYFIRHGVQYRREHKLKNGIVDFFFPRSGLILEVKASKQWSKTSVFRQIEKYCENEEVKGAVLATGHFQGLPDVISGKPARTYQLGLGLL